MDGTFSTTVPRATKHVVLETAKGEFFILSLLGQRTDCQVIAISPQCGSLDVRTVADEAAGLQWLAINQFRVASRLEARAILGYVVVAGHAHLLLATKVRPDPMPLFGGHQVYTIEEKQWLRIELRSEAFAASRQELKNLELLYDFPLEGLHYYSETFDLTRPFPSPFAVAEYDPEFCWNDWLAERFARIGMRMWCPVLLQGMAQGRLLPSTEGSPDGPVYVCLVTRKSNLNPGPRYYARGLNSKGGVGNEMEVELIMWRGTAEVTWTSYVWRRGTAPIWWRSELRSQMVTQSDVVISEKPFENCETYYQSLLHRYGEHPVLLFNMLRCDAKQEEFVLSEKFQDSIKYVKSKLSMDLRMVNFDWHHTLKQLGPQVTIAGLWTLMHAPIAQSNLSHGVIRLSDVIGSVDGETPGLMVCPSGHRADVASLERQRGILRFNCADSLDRTNIATFFVSFQVAAEMCRRMHVPLDLDQLPPSLPKERLGAFALFDVGLDVLVRVMRPSDVLPTLAEFFVMNGDVCSLLYTNSPAMHSALMRDYSPAVGAAPSNTLVALQRRYQNVYLDAARQAQYEMLLGLNRDKHFPSYGVTELLECVSRPPACVLKELPCLLRSADPNVLLMDHGDFCWICPPLDFVEVFVCLRDPCFVHSIALTVTHGASSETSPRYLDIFLGSHVDSAHLACQGLTLPRCASGTRLLYPIAATRGTGTTAAAKPAAYDFDLGADDGDGGEANETMARIVHLMFRSGDNSDKPAGMTLGKIEIYGRVLGQELPQRVAGQILFERSLHQAADIVGALDSSARLMQESDGRSPVDRATRSPVASGPSAPQPALAALHSADSVELAGGQLRSEPDAPAASASDQSALEMALHSSLSVSSVASEPQSAASEVTASASGDARRPSSAPSASSSADVEWTAAAQAAPPTVAGAADQARPAADGEDSSVPPLVRRSSQRLSDSVSLAPGVEVTATLVGDGASDVYTAVVGLERAPGADLSTLGLSDRQAADAAAPSDFPDASEVMPGASSGGDSPTPTSSTGAVMSRPSASDNTQAPVTGVAAAPPPTEVTTGTSGRRSSASPTDASQPADVWSSTAATPMAFSPVVVVSDAGSSRSRTSSFNLDEDYDGVQATVNAEDSDAARTAIEALSARQLSSAEQEYFDEASRRSGGGGGGGAIDGYRGLSLLDTLELEWLRLQRGITPQQRDQILTRLKPEVPLEAFNPNRFLYPRDPNIEAAMRKSKRFKNSKCHRCENSLGLFGSKQCAYCYYRYCSNCFSPTPIQIVEFMWDKPQAVCKACFNTLNRHRQLMTSITEWAAAFRKQRLAGQLRLDTGGGLTAAAAKRHEFDGRLHNLMASSLPKSSTAATPAAGLNASSFGAQQPAQQQLALYPAAVVLVSVPTAAGSPPVESVLYPVDLVPLGPAGSCWSAPAGTASVQILVCLAQESVLESVSVLCDGQGFAATNAPSLRLMCGRSLSSLHSCDAWQLPEISPFGAWRHVLPSPQTCLVVALTVSLPGTHSPSDVLRLGRVQFVGRPSPSIHLVRRHPLQGISPAQRLEYETAYNMPSDVTRREVPARMSQLRPGSRPTLDVVTDAPVDAFAVAVRHSDGDDGPTAQVQWIRVSSMTSDVGDVASVRQICKVLVPLTSPKAELLYGFGEVVRASMLSFEFLSNYGGAELCPPKITLFYK